ncbi:MAG TPA: cytochrome o ubiquinol oxidase subunit IV [Spirochaetia bacterium]|nr:cytochrome o ubiquinol oxidase subunit IV [Spirochaetia bacterium]
MSNGHIEQSAGHGTPGSHTLGHVAGAGHGTAKSYIWGFVLSIILTVIPFAIVMTSHMSHVAIVVTIVIFAVIQILVHLVFFLHMNTSSEQRWNLVAFVYTVILLGILVGGSIWIMVHLNANMMMN